MEEEEFIFDFTSEEAVKTFLGENEARHANIANYAAEYEGTDDGRKLRPLQIGERENFRQGTKTIEAEKLKIQYQKKIVNTAVSFLFGDAPTINANDPEKEAANSILKVWRDNRLSSKLQDFAEAVMSTTIGVFIFTKVLDEIKARFYNYEKGKYTPQYDVYGDLVAFYWQFKIGEVEHLWIFTATEIHKYEDEKYVTSDAHDFGVIPVVFAEQKEPEWWEVKELIDRLEMIVSKLAGSNNYFAFPILKLIGGTPEVDEKTGEPKTTIDVSEDGKAILLGYAEKNGQVIQSDAEFLQRDTGVASIELEKNILQEFIHSISQTPDLSFDNVKGIGAISGRALVLMLQDAINKAKRKRGVYQTSIERILSIIKNGLKISDEELEFDVEFNLSIPEDLKETIDMLYSATGGKATMSQEAAIQNNPLVKDPSAEMEKIREENKGSLGESMDL